MGYLRKEEEKSEARRRSKNEMVNCSSLCKSRNCPFIIPFLKPYAAVGLFGQYEMMQKS